MSSEYLLTYDQYKRDEYMLTATCTFNAHVEPENLVSPVERVQVSDSNEFANFQSYQILTVDFITFFFVVLFTKGVSAGGLEVVGRGCTTFFNIEPEKTGLSMWLVSMSEEDYCKLQL